MEMDMMYGRIHIAMEMEMDMLLTLIMDDKPLKSKSLLSK
jgi:hypothetical protein